jgi:hypothetical protein
MSAFNQAIALTPHHPGNDSFTWEVPDGWQQGRGSWGGLPVGAMLAAVAHREADPRRTIRSISAQLIGPAVVGRHPVTVTAVRTGKAMTTWVVEIRGDDGAMIALATVLTGAPRGTLSQDVESTWCAMESPAAPTWRDVLPVPTPPPFPTFTQHCEYRVISGTPMQGGRAETLGWIGYREPTEWTAASLIALADAWYTVTMVGLQQMIPVATINFSANLLIDPAELPAGEPLLHHAVVSGVHDGYASEHRRLWTADGRLAVDNLQSVAVG